MILKLILISYIFFLILSIVTVAIGQIKQKVGDLYPSAWIRYLCLTLSALVSVALLVNLIDYDSSIIWFYIIFGTSTFISVPISLWALLWKVEYNDKTLTYRNPFGIKKTYNIAEISLTVKNQYTSITANEKRITDYNFMLMKITKVKSFEAYISSIKNQTGGTKNERFS